MDCDTCEKEEATIFLSHFVGGKLQKVNLCKKCADEKGVTDPTGFALTDMLEGMGEETVKQTPAASPGELQCPSCGFTQSDFKKTGRFGCADCYKVFDEGLDGLLEAMHKNTKHTGKRPAGRPEPPESEGISIETAPEEPTEPISPADKLKQLKESLNASVKAEDYEEAARLRDAISQLEAQIENLP